MPTPRRLRPAPLPDDLVEKIILRFPPDDPAGLVDGALVCKDWCRVICSPDFRRRFREFHRNPPLLGILYRSGGGNRNQQETNFLPSSTFRLRLPSSDNKQIPQWRAIDTLHGRVLLWDESLRRAFTWPEFIVWSPVPSQTRRLPVLRQYMYTNMWSAALLCAATAGCDHLDCTSSSGAFFVVFVGTDSVTTSAYIYSSEQNVWSEAGFVRDHHSVSAGIKRPSARVENTVYFICERSENLLAYELCKKKLSFVSIPSELSRDYNNRFTAFTAAEDGKLGLATAVCFRLVTWSREEAGVSLDGDAGWTQQREFDLDKLLPSCTLSYRYDFFATTNNNGVIVVKGNKLLFAIDLKSGKAKELLNGCAVQSIYHIVPYIGFCTPSLPQCKFT
ncbi:hypothetical protein EJB05_13811, partial [Eragrostis curvula]